MSLSLAPVSDRSSKSPPPGELIALSVLLFTQQAHTVKEESTIFTPSCQLTGYVIEQII